MKSLSLISAVTNSGPINEGSSATITVNASDPARAKDPLSYEFNCNNDGTYEVGPQPGNSTTVTFDDNGSFNVNVRVSDGDGGVTTGSTIVVVNNVAPTPTITGAPATSPEGTAINISGSATDPSSVDTSAGFTYAWSVTKNGNPYASGSGPSFSFTPNDNGSYVVTLSATDKDGATGTTSKTITVTNVAPSVGTLTGAILFSGQTYTASGSFADSGSADTWTAKVDYGEKLNLTASSTQASLTGKTSSGIYFEGSDSVRIVPSK